MNKRKATHKKKSDFGVAMIFAAPFTIGFLVFILYPFIMSFYYSLTEFNGLKDPVFVGLQNYKNLVNDPIFWKSLSNTFYMVLLGVPLICISGLLAASLLNVKVPFLGLFRTIMYLPSVIPGTAVALIWSWIMNPNYGLINSILEKIGLEKIGWLADAKYAKPALLIIGVWAMGNVMVMYLAALQDVPKELYESAKIDGAGVARRFLSVTIPSIRPVIVYNLVTTTIAYFRYFDLPYVINTAMDSGPVATIGTPLNSTMFFGTYIYMNSFKHLKMGYSSAMSWILLVMTLVVMIVMLKWGGMIDPDEE